MVENRTFEKKAREAVSADEEKYITQQIVERVKNIEALRGALGNAEDELEEFLGKNSLELYQKHLAAKNKDSSMWNTTSSSSCAL